MAGELDETEIELVELADITSKREIAEMNRVEWYRTAAINLGLPSLLRRQFAKRFQSELSFHLTSRYLLHPVFARPGTSDLFVFDQIFVEREYRCLDHTDCSGLIIDLGANVGYSSAYFLSSYPKAFLISVEPDPDNFALLSRNLEPYKDRCRLVKAAVWPEKAKLQFKEANGRSPEWGRSVEAGVEGDVEAVTVPSLIENSPHRRVSILKVDIEGAERQLFGANTDWLSLVDNIVIELHGSECTATFLSAIDQAAFAVSRCGELTVCRGRAH
jgi:FkbM family methyltransferase